MRASGKLARASERFKTSLPEGQVGIQDLLKPCYTGLRSISSSFLWNLLLRVKGIITIRQRLYSSLTERFCFDFHIMITSFKHSLNSKWKINGHENNKVNHKKNQKALLKSNILWQWEKSWALSAIYWNIFKSSAFTRRD